MAPVQLLLGQGPRVGVVADSVVSGHAPVELIIPGPLELDLGVSIRRPNLVQVGPDAPLQMSASQQDRLSAAHGTSSAEEYWRIWNEVAEECLLSQVQDPLPHRSRGTGGCFKPNSPSAPQDFPKGCATTSSIIAVRRRLSGHRRLQMYSKRVAAMPTNPGVL